MKWILILTCLLTTGCDRLQNKSGDDRRLQMDCEIKTPDGAIMRCRQDLEKNIESEDDSISIKQPGG